MYENTSRWKTPGRDLPWILRHLLRSLVDSSTPHCCVLQCAAAGEITYQLINHSHCRLVKFSISRQSNPVKWMIDPPGRRGSPDTTLQIHTEESYRSDSPEFSELQQRPHLHTQCSRLCLECCATLRLAGGRSPGRSLHLISANQPHICDFPHTA